MSSDTSIYSLYSQYTLKIDLFFTKTLNPCFNHMYWKNHDDLNTQQKLDILHFTTQTVNFHKD